MEVSMPPTHFEGEGRLFSAAVAKLLCPLAINEVLLESSSERESYFRTQIRHRRSDNLRVLFLTEMLITV